jgi:hypothetical protein
MKLWPKIRNSGLLWDILGNKKEVSYWGAIFDKTYKGMIDAWSYQWLFACWLQNGLNIFPRVNLVSNIGFGKTGTHTKSRNEMANLESKPIIFPLAHPPYALRDVDADKLTEKYQFGSRTFYRKIINKIWFSSFKRRLLK